MSLFLPCPAFHGIGSKSESSSGSTIRNLSEVLVIILGVILLIIGLIAKISILTTIGAILAVVGIVLVVLGRTGRKVGGRAHYF